MRGILSHGAETSRAVALALVEDGDVTWRNPLFETFDANGEEWRWLSGPHARVRYSTLSELVKAEAATLAPGAYLSRFERGRQMIDVRLERLERGMAAAWVHDVSSEVRRQRELQRDREALLHEERMH